MRETGDQKQDRGSQTRRWERYREEVRGATEPMRKPASVVAIRVSFFDDATGGYWFTLRWFAFPLQPFSNSQHASQLFIERPLNTSGLVFGNHPIGVAEDQRNR